MAKKFTLCKCCNGSWSSLRCSLCPFCDDAFNTYPNDLGRRIQHDKSNQNEYLWNYFLKCYDMPNYFIVLKRNYYFNDGICGGLYLLDCDKDTIVFRCNTLEHSSKFIPKGDYPVVVNYSPKFNMDLPLVLGVPDRDGIRFHVGNYERDTTGCILVGSQTFNSATLYDSRKALELLLSYIKYADNIRLLIV